MNIAVIGSGYVGLVAGACFAEIGHSVVLVDNDISKLAALNSGKCPIHEKFLPELLQRHSGKRLRFSHDLDSAVCRSQIVFIAVGTPAKEDGSADLSCVESVARGIAGAINSYKIVVEKSTVPVFTNSRIRKIMLSNGVPERFIDVASNPEFLREGTAVTDFLYPDRIVIGADTSRCSTILEQLYKPMLDGSYYRRTGAVAGPDSRTSRPRLIRTSPNSAELIKHASNAFLAMKISFSNALACMCESVGADVEQVCQGVGSDSRIGREFLFPGIGYGGACFPKDLLAFRAVARAHGCDFGLVNETIRINEEQRTSFVNKVRKVLGTLRGKNLAVLGLAFKNGTDDIRESPAVAVVKALLRERCSVTAYDPAAMERAAKEFSPGALKFVANAYEALKGADACLVLTEWKDFAILDALRMRNLMRRPIVIDGRNLFDPSVMAAAGMEYYSIGRPDIVRKIQNKPTGSQSNENLAEENTRIEWPPKSTHPVAFSRTPKHDDNDRESPHALLKDVPPSSPLA